MRLITTSAIFALAFFIGSPGNAASGAASGSGSMGYGYAYEYTASWETSGPVFSFVDASDTHPGFLGKFVSPATHFDVETFDFTGTINLRIFDISTGMEGVPSRQASASPYPISFGGQYFVDLGAVGQGIRFSNSVLTSQNTVTGPGGAPLVLDSSHGSITYRLSVHFGQGNFLASSPDPACASFSCMVPGGDQLRIADAGMFALAVPEPGTYAMLIAGLVAVGCACRRKAAARPAAR